MRDCTADRHGDSEYAYRHLRCRCPAARAAATAANCRRRRLAPPRPASDWIDEIAVERAVHGDPVRLSFRERRVAIARLDRAGLSARAIGARIGITARTVQRYRSQAREVAA